MVAKGEETVSFYGSANYTAKSDSRKLVHNFFISFVLITDHGELAITSFSIYFFASCESIKLVKPSPSVSKKSLFFPPASAKIEAMLRAFSIRRSST